LGRDVVRLIALAAAFTSLPAASQIGHETPPTFSAQSKEGQATKSWTGEWIACPNAPVRDEGVFHFRKRIVLAERPEYLPLETDSARLDLATGSLSRP
jgi:hypothetical protein